VISDPVQAKLRMAKINKAFLSGNKATGFETSSSAA
jgi:hypothetical protein